MTASPEVRAKWRDYQAKRREWIKVEAPEEVWRAWRDTQNKHKRTYRKKKKNADRNRETVL